MTSYRLTARSNCGYLIMPKETFPGMIQDQDRPWDVGFIESRGSMICEWATERHATEYPWHTTQLGVESDGGRIVLHPTMFEL